MPEQNTDTKEKSEVQKRDGTLDKVIAKIGDAENVLVALSDNPSVDEMAAAIGLTMVLDSIGKHATAIYSGKTPNVLEFLNPQETFETNTDSLQDFIIALNKEKADHLRYKVDGDFVKVYITPYRTTISENDLEFSRGDFNVDLVIALNVAAATDLDGALREHGRIMHDASAINITTGAPGKFGEVEWVDTAASSISEMVTNLATRLQKDLDKGTATALLTGLVAATDRFSNDATTPAVMVLAAKLMGAGADQQLVAANISGKVSFDESGEVGGDATATLQRNEDKSKLDIRHGDTESSSKKNVTTEGNEDKVSESELVGVVEDSSAIATEKSEAAEEPSVPLVVGEVEPSPMITPIGESSGAFEQADEPEQASPAGANVIAGVEITPTGENSGVESGDLADQMVQRITGVGSTEPKDYGKMIDEALAEPLPGEGGIQVGANTASGPMTDVQDVTKVEAPEMASQGMIAESYQNPAMGATPEVGAGPAVNNIPDMSFGPVQGNTAEGGESYLVNNPEKVLNPVSTPPSGFENFNTPMNQTVPTMEPVPVPSGLPMPGQEILPPPPTPPVDFSMDSNLAGGMLVPEMPQVQVDMPDMNNTAVVTPEAPGVQAGSEQGSASEPGAFQIPGQGF